MKEKLIIVESPSKAKAIQSYLGEGHTVVSSKGHIRDLATSGKGGLGIDVEANFEPTYQVIRGKQTLINDLKKQAKSRDVLIATDQDREGEAIAWHIAQVLNLDVQEENRVEFSEITKQKILEAVKKPRKINIGLVSSQETRRMLDRIIGFKLSTLLQSKIKSKSAGRVQSVALKLIVDLEKEIKAFIPKTYFDIEATYQGIKADYIKNKDQLDKSTSDVILKEATNPFTISKLEVNKKQRHSKEAFKTSTLQRDAYNYLGYTPPRTMMLAQYLYEGIKMKGETTGLITYMRTDVTRLSNEFVDAAMMYIQKNYGEQYLGKYQTTKDQNAQDAHEGIRPTNVIYTPEYVKANVDASSIKDEKLFEDALKLYGRIYGRTFASLMAPAILEHTKVTFTSNNHDFNMKGVRLIFDGFLKVYEESKNKDILLPKFHQGNTVTMDEIVSIEKQTQPKSRYNEASMIKKLDELGIGRPSTYASIIKTLIDRGYVTKEKNLQPTDQGILTSDELDKFFKDIINIDYTAEMEANLDKVSEGNHDKQSILKTFYEMFMPMLENAKVNMKKIQPVMLDETCPECGSQLVIRKSKYGEFVACSGFPKCRYIKKEETASDS
ncbi:MAG: type I DNA topoisomerase [Acholeplasmataceae bacterium]